MDESSIRECCKSSNYAFTGKLMLISVVVVVFVCVFLGFFHVFARRVFRSRNLGFLEASGAAVGDSGAQIRPELKPEAFDVESNSSFNSLGAKAEKPVGPGLLASIILYNKVNSVVGY